MDSTCTPREDSTLRMSRPSSASSLFINTPLLAWSEPGLSPSSIPPAKSGFRNAFLNASAMIAASAPEKGPPSPAEPPCDAVEAPSGDMTEEARCSYATPPAAPAAPAASIPPPPSNGDRGEFACSALAIMGDAEPMEPRFESSSFRRRMRRIQRKARIPPARIARRPRTTMTPIAHLGKLEAPVSD